ARGNPARGLEARHPAHRAGDAHPETLGRRIARHAAVHHCPHNALAKIVGKRHPRRLLRAAKIMNQNSSDSGIPQRFTSLGYRSKRVMIRLWNKSTGQPATLKQGQCLWGMTKDVMALLDELGLPAEAGGELAIAAFKYAIGKQGWPTVYVHIKVMAQELSDGKVIYLQHPSVSVIRRFWKEVLRVYLEDGHIPPKGGGIDLAWKGSGMKLAMALEEKIYQEIE